MKVGIISDIHGNIKALEAVLQEYAKYNVQEVIDYMRKTQIPGYKATLRLFYGTSK